MSYSSILLQIELLQRRVTMDQDAAKTNLQIACERLGVDYEAALAQVSEEAKRSRRGWANACRLVTSRLTAPKEGI